MDVLLEQCDRLHGKVFLNSRLSSDSLPMFRKLSPVGVFAVGVIFFCTSLQVFVLPACLQIHRLYYAFRSWHAQQSIFLENLNNCLRNLGCSFLSSYFYLQILSKFYKTLGFISKKTEETNTLLSMITVFLTLVVFFLYLPCFP